MIKQLKVAGEKQWIWNKLQTSSSKPENHHYLYHTIVTNMLQSHKDLVEIASADSLASTKFTRISSGLNMIVILGDFTGKNGGDIGKPATSR